MNNKYLFFVWLLRFLVLLDELKTSQPLPRPETRLPFQQRHNLSISICELPSASGYTAIPHSYSLLVATNSLLGKCSSALCLVLP